MRFDEPAPVPEPAWFEGPHSFAGRRVLVCGAGVAGEPAARALLSLGAAVSIVDARRGPAIEALERAGASYLGDLAAAPEGIDLLAVSPGWPPGAPLLRDAIARGLPCFGELELAWRLRGAHGAGVAPWLALTGTNGKTTTVHMLESMLRSDGRRAAAVGNVGVSVIDAVMAGTGPDGYDVLAVEVSSFQLHWSQSVRPAAAAVLNIAPDHLDWHGSLEAYAQAKEKLLDSPVAIGWPGDARVAAMLRRAGADPGRRAVAVSLDEPHAGELGVRDGQLVDRAFADPGRWAAGEPLAQAAAVRPPGRHNVLNALAAAALARAFGVGAEAIAEGLARFVPDHHRNEPIGALAVDGGVVDFVDDSKATNPHAARASLEAHERIVWVAGGQLKGAPVAELIADIAPRLVGAVLLGADRAQIASALARHAPQIPVIDVPSTDDGVMFEVVRSAVRLASPGDTILLAPAAASLDMFPSYADRGRAFAAAARELFGSRFTSFAQ